MGEKGWWKTQASAPGTSAAPSLRLAHEQWHGRYLGTNAKLAQHDATRTVFSQHTRAWPYTVQHGTANGASTVQPCLRTGMQRIYVLGRSRVHASTRQETGNPRNVTSTNYQHALWRRTPSVHGQR